MTLSPRPLLLTCLVLIALVSTMTPAAIANPGAALAARDDVPTGALTVSDDGSVSLVDSDGATLLRVPGSLLEDMTCPETPIDPSTWPTRNSPAGTPVLAFVGDSRTVFAGLSDRDLVFVEWNDAASCWRQRSVFDAQFGLTELDTPVEAATGMGPFITSVELDATARGTERVVIEGDTLRVEHDDGTALGEPVTWLPIELRCLESAFEFAVAVGRFQDGATALQVRAACDDGGVGGRDVELVTTLAVERDRLVEVVEQWRDDLSSGDRPNVDVLSRRHGLDGRIWILERHARSDFWSNTFLALRGDAICDVTADHAPSSNSLRWFAGDSPSAAPHDVASALHASDELSEEVRNCQTPSDALLAVVQDVRLAVPESLAGTQLLYEVRRRGNTTAREAASLNYFEVREVTAVTREKDHVRVDLEVRGGADASRRAVIWTVDARCFEERGPHGEVRACLPDVDSDMRFEDVVVGGIAAELAGPSDDEAVQLVPELGASWVAMVDSQRDLEWSFSLIGARTADGVTLGEADREALGCDWDLSDKARDGAIELDLSGDHAARHVSVVVAAASDTGMRASLQLADGSQALELASTATLTRAKRWRDPSSGLEFVVLQAEGPDGLEVHTIVLDGDEARPSKLAFAPGDDGEQDFATLMIAGRDSCLLRVVRGEGEDSRVADHELTSEGLRRAGHGSLEPR